ncbi:hypothetical protein KSP40_PGU003492 [Platanthera guangdongensis]|uniref:F-box domain-containing protein n=1 Tax=Platanthera guangdongensis TaxID=2320717 RepID=A0ABR2M6G9_9ASPA
MDGVVCDELLQEIIQRLPPSSFAAVSLVSKRWLSALRSSTTSLSLSIPFSAHPFQSSSLSSILSHYPHLHSLSIHSSPFDADDGESYPPSPPPKTPTSISSLSLSSDALLLAVASSPSSSRLNQLRFATAAIPVSPAALLSSSSSLTRLTDLHLSSVFPYSFRWLAGFPFIKSLSLVFCPKSPAALGLLELELRSSRAIADRVLLHAADRCHRLKSFLLHDGGGSEALHHFIALRAAGLHTIDLRLPLDLHNYHLSAIAASPSTHSPRLSTLRLQSCCLVTGDGLRSVASATAGKAIEELALVNCDVVEREPGLLCVLGQSLPRLRKLDLSFNEMMTDKELVAMRSSFSGLVEIKLQGCGKLTDASLVWLLPLSSSKLEVADLRRCPGISPAAIETFVLMSFRLKLLCVEKKKMSEAAMAVASPRGIWIGD